MPFFKAVSAVFLLFAAFSAFSADEVQVDANQALGPLEYSNPLVRDVPCFDIDGDCYYVMTGSLQQNSVEQNYLSLWNLTENSIAEQLAALPVGDEFIRLVSETSGNWLSLYVQTTEAVPAVYVFNKSDKSFVNVSEIVAIHGALDKLKGAKVGGDGVLTLLFDSSAGCCEIVKMEIKSGKILEQDQLSFAPGEKIVPLDFDVLQSGYALAGALRDSKEDIGAVGISGKKGNELTTAQGKDRYYYALAAEGGDLYATGRSMKSDGEMFSVFRAKGNDRPELVAEKFSRSSGSGALSFGRLCGTYFYEAFTDQNTEPFLEFNFLVAPSLDSGEKAGGSDYKIRTTSPRVFKSVIPYVQRNQLFILLNTQEFDEVTRGFHNRIYRKEVAKFAFCAE